MFVSLGMAQNNSGSESTHSDLEWYSFDEARELASGSDKLLFLFFEAEWCGFCKQMHNEVFPIPEIRNLMSDYFYPVIIDLESEAKLNYDGKKKTEKSFSHQMRINATPTIIFMTDTGEVKGVQSGFLNESDLKDLIVYVGEGYINQMDFKEFKERNIAGNTENSN
jgi:thioredoxin-related protein